MAIATSSSVDRWLANIAGKQPLCDAASNICSSHRWWDRPGTDEMLELTGGDILAGSAGAVGAIVDADTGEDMLERLTGSDVVGSGSFTSHFVSSGGAGTGAVGKAVDADVGYEDGAVEWCE